MYSLHQNLPDSMNSFKFDNAHASTSVSLNEPGTVVNGNDLKHEYKHQPPLPLTNRRPSNDSSQSSSSDSDGESSFSIIKGDFSGAVFKFISDMLMEEDLDTKPCMFQNSVALQAAEKSFYDVLGQKYPPSPDHNFSPRSDLNVESSVDSSNSYAAANNMVDSFLISDQVEFEYPHLQTSSLFDIPENSLLGVESYGNIHNIGKLKGGIEEASSRPQLETAPYAGKDWRNNPPNRSRGRKSHQRDDGDYVQEGRSNKVAAPSPMESLHSDLFDEVLLCQNVNDESIQCPIYEGAQKWAAEKLQQNGQFSKGNGRSTRAKKQGGSEGKLVDLWTLLTQCAQAVSSSDQRMTNGLLRQIRQHSSVSGDATQRTAYYFANALEARLAGTQTPLCTPIVSSKTSAADIIKAYKAQISVCPFRLLSNALANRTIAKLGQKATRIHIIDFGILYGFQWPCFIQRISRRPGGPPKLRFTGIDFPQPGFRPAERVEETGERLKRYCERFNVPFEYTAIAQRWDSIRLEDLKIDREELTVVNCLYRLKNLPDDTMVLSSPRDTVLRLIKKINPSLFFHGIVNGAFNAPFFTTRFREALFYYSTMFDMYDANLPREDEERLLIEREMMGREAVNIVACEGSERIERPETYKQWQARNQRIGFRQLPLERDILKEIKKIFKSKYHEDYVLDEDGHWMLQGWKGRILQAISCWKPVQD